MTVPDELRAFVANARWIFACTMPQNPLSDTHLGRRTPKRGFEWFVMFIRKNGYREEFKGNRYVKLSQCRFVSVPSTARERLRAPC